MRSGLPPDTSVGHSRRMMMPEDVTDRVARIRRDFDAALQRMCEAENIEDAEGELSNSAGTSGSGISSTSLAKAPQTLLRTGGEVTLLLPKSARL